MIALKERSGSPVHLKMTYPISSANIIQDSSSFKMDINADNDSGMKYRLGGSNSEDDIFNLSLDDSNGKDMVYECSPSSSTSLSTSYRNSESSVPSSPGSPATVFDSETERSNGKQIKEVQDKESAIKDVHALLQFLEPGPVEPPSYEDIPPGGCPRFGVTMNEGMLGSETLPNYTPAVYKIGLVMKKTEWLTPYEVSPTRSWRPYIMELNSTQLNFYQIPSSMESFIMSYDPEESEIPSSRDIINYNSLLTTIDDLRFHNFCRKLSLLEKHTDSRGGSNSKGKFKNCKLLRSYTLQYARIGLAVDYRKKPNVLRLRIESEQILLQFSSSNDVIMWNNALVIGKDIALDLSDRSVPRERSLPRRRRRNGSRRAQAVHDAIIRAERSTNKDLQNPRSISSTFSKIKSKFHSASRRDDIEVSKDPRSMSSSTSESSSRSSLNVRGTTLTEALTINRGTNVDDEYADDLQSLSDLHVSDFDEYEIDYIHEDTNEADNNMFNNFDDNCNENDDSRSDEDYKWNSAKASSDKKYIRNCLKCIKPLTMDDSWACKILVKPTSSSSISMLYMKAIYADHEYSKDRNYHRKRTFSFGSTYSLPSVALTRLPNHHLKEYIVGTHSLIPREF